MLNRIIKINESGSVGAFATTYFWQENSEMPPKKRPVVVICPGGVYCSVSYREGEPIALQFMAHGYNAVVLNYSVHPYAHYPTALFELGRVVQMLRERADEWLIDADKIMVMGFSAGGHLAASYSCFWSRGFISDALGCAKEELKPNGLLLGYPVITSKHTLGGSFRHLLGDKYDELVEGMSLEKQVTDATPPTFIWHTFVDESVSYKNSELFEKALREKNIAVELHIYPEGMHGLALANEVTAVDGSQIVPSCQDWIEKAFNWMNKILE